VIPAARVRRPLGSCLAAGLLALVPTPARAESAAPRVDQPNLLALHGETVAVRYAPGSLDRAAHLQDRLQTLVSDAGDWLRVRLDVRAYVLGPDEWAAAGVDRPYGLPARAAGHEIAAAAWGDDGSVALWRGILGGPLPWGEGVPVRGTVEEAASLALGDLLAQVEVGRMAVEAAGWRGDPAALEVAAHVVAATAFAVHEPERLAEIRGVFARLEGLAPGATVGTGRDEQLSAWLREQGIFFRAAEVVLERDGTRAAKRLAQLARKGKGNLRRDLLLDRYPQLLPFL
jgi:hypothetical protein